MPFPTASRPLALVLLGVCIMLSACASRSSFDGRVRSLVGHPVNDAVLMLDEKPLGQYENKGGGITYVWQGRKTESVFPAVMRVGRAAGHDRMYDIYGAKLSGLVTDTCVIRMATTKGGLITDVSLEGSVGGCEMVYGE